MYNYAKTIFPHICLSACLHTCVCQLPWLKYRVGAALTLSFGLPSYLLGEPVVNSSTFGAFFSSGVWHAFRFWIGESVFVPNERIRDQTEAFLHLYPLHITSQLSLSHYHSPFLSISSSFTLVVFDALN